MESDTLSRLRQILVDEFEVDPEGITPEARIYEDLDIDSIDAIDLIVRLKEITGKKVPAEKFKEVRTIADIVNVLQAL
ncbi:MAG: acyl carrier protein [Gammaproteobacteria bacterium]